MAFDIFEGEGHVPIKGFYKGLMNLFSGWIPELQFFINGNLEDIKNHYKGLSDRFGFKVLPLLRDLKARTAGNISTKKCGLFEQSIRRKITCKRMPCENPVIPGSIFILEMNKELFLQKTNKFSCIVFRLRCASQVRI